MLIAVEGELECDGPRLQGWVAAAVVHDHAYMVTAMALVEEWERQESTFRAMLESVQLSTPLPHFTYVVQAGDTLSSVASRFGTTVQAIMELNGLTSPTINVGQELLIPGGENRVSVPTTTPSPPLVAPTQRAPADGTVFNEYPRTMTLQWSAVPGAASYTVEIDCYHCCEHGAWCTDLGETWGLYPEIEGTSHTTGFAGAQPGRWRVWAVDAEGREGPKSGWWEFVHRR